ncbi:stage II sporulation protein M [Cohnella xylanilytica]|uniref:stage II sporulation protein M n=1 Tax=Cohnella xylanilytica TaxID=557555 RepID=UPI001B228FA7|nr:stage II sporulation protein M [Cohnella xylanilytica]GIO11763.1 stage II sporulation protein M [Cohnella xylanilytica]
MNVRPWNLSARNNLNLYVFIGVLLLSGAVFGALLVNALTLDQQQELAEELKAYWATFASPEQLDSGAAFWDRFLLYAKWLALIWLLGLSVIGVPLMLALDFMKGVLLGFAVGLIVREMAWKGVAVSLAAVAPQNALVIPALAIASVSGARFAHYVVRERLFRRKGRLLPPFLAHTSVALTMLLMLGCATLYEAYVSPYLLERVAPGAAAAVLSALNRV